MHLLVDCIKAKAIWDHIRETCIKLKIDFNLSTENIIYNRASKIKVVIFIVLIVKFYIFRCKCQEKTPHINGALFDIKEAFLIEKYMAKEIILLTSFIKHGARFQFNHKR